MDSPLKITRMYGELMSRKSKRAFEAVEFAIEDYVTIKENDNMKPTELLELIKIAHDYMVVISLDKTLWWEENHGNKLINGIKKATVPENKINDYHHFVNIRKIIWELELELGIDDVFIGYTELVCAAHEHLVEQPELMLDDVLSQCDSDAEQKVKKWDEMKPVGRELI